MPPSRSRRKNWPCVRCGPRTTGWCSRRGRPATRPRCWPRAAKSAGTAAWSATPRPSTPWPPTACRACWLPWPCPWTARTCPRFCTMCISWPVSWAWPLLPFTKFLHMITAPLLMALNAGMGRQEMDPAAKAFYRALELDACTHCGTCSVHCSVAPGGARHTQPDHPALGKSLRPWPPWCAAKNGAAPDPALLRQGAYVCTDCGRCTRLCPGGHQPA